MISLIPADRVLDIWKDVEPLVEEALQSFPGRYASVDILSDIMTGNQLLWVYFDEDFKAHSILTTKLIIYPLCRTIRIELLAGKDIDTWFPEMHKIIQSFAKDNEVKFLEASGREGWVRALRKYGWRVLSTWVELEVKE